ncbi:protein LURP-one-related 11-like [Typha latifolia]|uniref:protein LURP-one-related 11-like n=1 Tax=Typha latifolia TaxID=4733 RepID=UPI003C2DFC19
MSLVTTREIYTVWMKSLVFNSNGCTIYDSDGRIAYRVDNYDCKCSDEVYFMDHSGKTLLKVLRKKFRLFRRWEGFRYNSAKIEEEKPWFRVEKSCRIPRTGHSSEITVEAGCGKCYKIVRWANKLEYRIEDKDGRIVAEIKRKQTASGIALGEDVLTLVLEPNVDHLLIMGLVVVCGLINHIM